MPLETVTIEVAGRALAIETIAITAGAEQAVRTANVRIAPASLRNALLVRWGDEAVVRAGGEAVVTGYVRDVNASHDAESHVVAFGIASRTCDVTESGIDHPTGHVEKATLRKILREYGAAVDVVEIGDFPEVAYHQAEPEETQYRTAERVARRQGVLIHDDGAGRLVLAKKPEGRHEGGLELGINIRSASASFSEQHRYERTVIKGQSSKGHGAAALRLKATARDGAVRSGRVRVLVLEADATAEEMRVRADTQRRRAAGLSVAASITSPGWRDRAGILWQPNWLVFVRDPAIGLDQDMVIRSVTYEQGEQTVATLTLVDPRALGGEDPKGESVGKTGVDIDDPTVEIEA